MTPRSAPTLGLVGIVVAATSLALLLPSSSALFQDQAGVVDWHQTHFGEPTIASWHGGKTVFTGSEDGVVTALSAKTGKVKWRRVLRADEPIVALGENLLSVSGDGRRAMLWYGSDGSLAWDASVHPRSGEQAAAAGSPVGLAFSKAGRCYAVLARGTVTCLAQADGDAKWTWSPADGGAGAGATPIGVVADGDRVHVGVEADGEVRVVSLGARDGGVEAAATQSVAAPSAAGAPLLFADGRIVSLDEAGAALRVVSADTGSGEGDETFAISSLVAGASADDGAAAGGGKAVSATLLDHSAVEVSHSLPAIFSVWLDDGRQLLAELSVSDEGIASVAPVHVLSAEIAGTRACGTGTVDDQSRALCVRSTADGATATLYASPSAGAGSRDEVNELPQLSVSQSGGVRSVFPVGYTRKSGGVAYRSLVVSNDGAVRVVQGGTEAWVSEEALAHVTQAVAVLPPTSSSSGGGGSGGGGGDGDDDAVLDLSFGARIGMQLNDVRDMVHRVTRNGLVGTLLGSQDGDSKATNPAYGFDKVLVLATRAGKLFGMRAETGDILWSRYTPLTRDGATLVVTRERQVVNHAPEVLLVGASADGTGEVQWLNAMTGEVMERATLPGKVGSVVPLPSHDATMRKSVLVVAADGSSARVLPETEASRAAFEAIRPAFVYHVAGADAVTGYALAPRSRSGEYAARSRWSLSAPAGAKVIGVESSSMARAAVNTPARVLGDDSLLLKYLNPHLIAVATEAPEVVADAAALAGAAAAAGVDAAGSTTTVVPTAVPTPSVVSIQIVDSVTGSVVYRVNHPSARGPVHMRVLENMAFYTFVNAKTDRNELGSMALYEGKLERYDVSPLKQPNISETFSSYDAAEPFMLHRTFVLPTHITAMSVTRTAHSITTPNLIFGLQTGSVMTFDTRWADPRRPLKAPSATEKLEGLVQYQPYLPMVHQNVLTYNLTVERASLVMAMPAFLESTTVVFAAGLDLFYTRTTPSQGFDVLAPDFNKPLLVLLIGALVAATAVAGYFARSKRLSASWK